MADKKAPTLAELRKTITPFQKQLLDEAWQHFHDTGDWPILRSLYNRHKDKAKVREALIGMGGSIGREENGPRRWSRYALSLLGTMLTSEGLYLQKLMVCLFEFQRELYHRSPSEEQATSQEIATALKLGKEDTALLGQLLWLDHFGGGRNEKEGTWTVSAMEEAADFPIEGGLSRETEAWLCRRYDRDASVFRDQRTTTPYLPDSFDAPATSIASISPNPPEIVVSLERLRARYPDSKKLGFLVMRFTASKPFARIVEVIKQTAKEHNLVVIRADESEFHADLWGNVRTILHGCSFGIAVYERIERNEPNANVGLEVGYLMAMNKPVLLLKDKTVDTLQSDLTGKLYKPFDPHDPENTIPEQLTRWLKDNGIVVAQ